MKLRVALLIAFPLILQATMAKEPAKLTIASANSFLTQAFSMGTASFVEYRDDGEWNSNYNLVQQVDARDCHLRLGSGTSSDGRTIHSRDIEWSQISEVSFGDTGNVIRGAVKLQDGSIVGSADIHMDSTSMGIRVFNAMNFLKKVCDQTGKTGF